MRPVSVSQLNGYIKRTLATDPILSAVTVRGEISKLTFHSSGHVYFTLKDETSRLSCFLAADRVPGLRFDLDEGMEILAEGSVSVYERGGYYSLNIRSVEAAGEGALNAAFEKLKAKLSAEGLFDEKLKRKLPAFPRLIGVVTSPTGAAVHDIITTVKRRDPLADILIYPCLVQGPGAAASVCAGIEALNRQFPQIDVLIVGRGGGSKEDLWTFNEESVARAVRASKIPVISAVGHEVDVTICDLAADVRGATPTAAAELAVPQLSVYTDAMKASSPEKLGMILSQALEYSGQRMISAMRQCSSGLEALASSSRLRTERGLADAEAAVKALFTRKELDLKLARASLDGADPMEILRRGYTAVKSADGTWTGSAARIKDGDRIKVVFGDGILNCLVEGREI